MAFDLRFPFLLVAGLAVSGAAYAQASKSPQKAAPTNVPETRYFTYLNGLMGDRADVILKETRQGGKLTAATLDVCFPAIGTGDRKDQFTVSLGIDGEKLTGSTQSREGKQAVTVDLVRKARGKTFDFSGKIKVGDAVSTVDSSENADISESEFKEAQPLPDNIATAPLNFTEVSPEALAVRVKRDALVDFVKALRGQNIQLTLYGLIASCAELRSDEQVLHVTVDPERAEAEIAKMRTQPGVVAAGWTEGSMDMERTIRFPSADWRTNGKVNREKVASTVSGVLSKTLPGSVVSSKWNDITGELTMTFKRPSPVLPALELTETLEITALVSSDKPGTSDRMLLWLGSPSIVTSDETAGAKLDIAENASGNDEESLSLDDESSLTALAKEFKGQRWDAETSAWK